MKAVIVGALAATAFAETAVITYPGKYIAGTPSAGTDCCPPDDDGVTLNFASGKVTATWKFAATCGGTEGAKVQGETFTGTATTPDATTGDVTWAAVTVGTATAGDMVLTAPGNANEDFILDTTDITGACTIPLTKVPTTTPSLPGVYTVTKKLGVETGCCYPTGDIVVRNTAGTTFSADFTFGTCTGTPVAFSEVEVSGSGNQVTTDKTFTVSDASSNDYTFVPAPVVEVAGASLLLDLSAVNSDCAATLTKKSLPTTLTYNKVFEVETESSATGCCYPDGLITATQDSTTKKVKLGWTFESDCTDTATKGKTVSVEGTIDSVTNDVTIDDSTNTGKSYTLVAPQTATGAWSLDLSDIATGCSAVLDTKSGYVLGLGSLVALSLSYIMF